MSSDLRLRAWQVGRGAGARSRGKRAGAGETPEIRRIAPFGDQSLSFRMYVPPGWHEDRDLPPIDSPDAFLVTIARFHRDAAGELPLIEVDFTLLGEEVSLGDWFDLYVQLGEIQVLRKRAVQSHLSDAIRCRARQTHLEEECLAEYFLGRDGKRIFMLIGLCAEDEYRRLATEFERAINSFRLLSPSRKRFVEEIAHFQSARGERLFSYPRRWKLTPLENLPPGKSGADLRFLEEEHVLGYMRYKRFERALYPTLRPDDVIREARMEVESSGFQPDGAGWRESAEPIYRREPETLQVEARGTFAGVQDEVIIELVTTDEAIHAFTLLTPSREENVRQWMLNRRAFQILIASARIEGS